MAIAPGASPELPRLVETLGIPVFTTAAGKGAIPKDHRLGLGVFGRIPGWTPSTLEDPLRNFLQSLDTLLVVGSSLAYARTKAQGLQLPPNPIHLDIYAESIGKLYQPTVGVVGDAKVVLGLLNAAIAGKPSQLEAGFDREIGEPKGKVSNTGGKGCPTR